MWVEIGIGVGTATTVFGLVALIVRNQNSRINEKVSVELFDSKVGNIEKDLKRGEQQFSRILEEMGEMKEMIGRIDERTKSWPKKTG